MLLKSLNDASFAHTYNACPYAGKPENREGPHYIDSIENYVRYLVNQTANDVELQGRNISMDRLYTILSLANWLLGRKITCVGTLNHNRQGIPTELKNTSKQVEFSVTCHYESVKKDLCLLSYTVKTKSSSKNNVLLLFTMRPLNGITREDNKQKPSIYKFYDFTKGGTDIVDQLNDYYTISSQSNSWDLVSFYYILDPIRVNSKTLFCIKKGLDVKKENTFDLTFELAKVLTYPFIEQRRINGLGKSVIEIDFVFNRQSIPPTVSKTERRFPYSSYKQNYFMCVEKCSTKKGKDNASCSKEDCKSCGKSVCRKHALRICEYCNNNAN